MYFINKKNKGATRVDNLKKLATLGTQDEDKHKTICVKHHYEQTNTNNVNKTRALMLFASYMYETYMTQLFIEISRSPFVLFPYYFSVVYNCFYL